MTTKLPCLRCGAFILPTTFEATKGVCMPCKEVHREDMRAAEAAHFKSRWKDNSVQALWVSLTWHVDNAKDGYSRLNPAEQRYYSLAAFDSVVCNGGFQEYFTHASSAHYEEVMDGLLEVRAFDTVALLGEAKHILFGEAEVPGNYMERFSAIGVFSYGGPESHSSNLRLTELDGLHRSDPDQLMNKLVMYAEEQGLLEPFRKGPPTPP